MVAVSRLSSRLHFSFDSTITFHKRIERTDSVANQGQSFLPRQSRAIKGNQGQSFLLRQSRTIKGNQGQSFLLQLDHQTCHKRKKRHAEARIGTQWHSRGVIKGPQRRPHLLLHHHPRTRTPMHHLLLLGACTALGTSRQVGLALAVAANDAPLDRRELLIAIVPEGGNRQVIKCNQEAIRGYQRAEHLMREAIRRSSIASKCNQRSSEATRAPQSPSKTIRGDQRRSEVTRGH